MSFYGVRLLACLWEQFCFCPTNKISVNGRYLKAVCSYHVVGDVFELNIVIKYTRNNRYSTALDYSIQLQLLQQGHIKKSHTIPVAWSWSATSQPLLFYRWMLNIKGRSRSPLKTWTSVRHTAEDVVFIDCTMTYLNVCRLEAHWTTIVVFGGM